MMFFLRSKSVQAKQALSGTKQEQWYLVKDTWRPDSNRHGTRRPDFSGFPLWTILNSNSAYFEETLNYDFIKIKPHFRREVYAYERGFKFLLLPLACTVLVWMWFTEHLSPQRDSVSKRTENKPDPWRWCNIPGILETTPWIPKLFLATWPNSGYCLCLPISVERRSLLWNMAATISTTNHQIHPLWLYILHNLENSQSLTTIFAFTLLNVINYWLQGHNYALLCDKFY